MTECNIPRGSSLQIREVQYRTLRVTLSCVTHEKNQVPRNGQPTPLST